MKARHRKMHACLQRSWKINPWAIHSRARRVVADSVVGGVVTGDGGRFSLQSSRYHYCTPGVTFEVFGSNMDEPIGHLTVEQVRKELSRRGGFVRFLESCKFNH